MKKDGSFLILFKNSKKEDVFLVFRSDYPVWVLTGGGIEEEENPDDAAIREAKEETGFNVKLIRKIGVYKIQGRHIHLYEGRVTSGIFQPEFPGCKGGWFNINYLPFSLISFTKQMINDSYNLEDRCFTKEITREIGLYDLKLLFCHPLATAQFFLSRIREFIF